MKILLQTPLLFLILGSSSLWAQVPGSTVPEFGIQTLQSAWTCHKVNPLADGRVLVTGSRNYKARVGQYTSTGTLDPGFATAGVWSQSTIDDVDIFDDLLQADGSHMVIGTSESFIPGRWLPWISHLSSDGQSASPIFLSGPAAGDQTVSNMAALKTSNGDNLVAYTQGPSASLGTTALRFFRLTGSGQPAGTFPAEGITMTPPLATKLYELKRIAEDSLGNFWAFGRITTFGAHPDSLFLAKLLSTGLPDLSFGSGGFRRFGYFPGTITPAGLSAGPGNTVTFSASADSIAFFVRLKANGDLDNSFATEGIAKKRFPANGFLYDHTRLPDGRLVGCGTSFNSGFAYDYYLTCLKSNGTTDSSFYDASGTRIFGGSGYDLFLNITSDAQGHLVAGGQTGPSFGESMATVGKFYATTAVSANQQKGVSAFSLYPNPAGETIQLKTESPILSITITDAMGRKCSPPSPEGGANAARQDVSGLKPGMYYVRIQTAEGTAVQKVVKE